VPAFEENIDFHRLLAKASKNYVFCILIEAILAVLSDFRSKLNAVEGVEPSGEITGVHEQQIEAILAKRKRKMAALIKKDLLLAKQILTSTS
jgi:DNA-binding GntR family transcriptional regulator